MNCSKCGATITSNASFCEYCGQPVTEQPEAVQQSAPTAVETAVSAPVQKPENVLTGTVGALIGAAIGGASIILLSQIGFVAALSGLILAVCTLKGYELLGGRLSTKGIIISIVLMLVTPYIADRIDWAIVVMNAYSDVGVTFGEAFAAIPALIEEEAIEMGSYLGNLAMLYLFTVLGAFGTVKNAFKK